MWWALVSNLVSACTPSTFPISSASNMCVHGWHLISLLCMWGASRGQTGPTECIPLWFVEVLSGSYTYYSRIILDLWMCRPKGVLTWVQSDWLLLRSFCQVAPASSPPFAKWILSMTRPLQGPRWRSGGPGSWLWRATRVATTSLTFKGPRPAPPVVLSPGRFFSSSS